MKFIVILKRFKKMNLTFKRKRKNHFNASPEGQRRNKINIEYMIDKIEIYLNSLGLKFSHSNIFHIEEYTEITLTKGNDIENQNDAHTGSDDKIESLQNNLKISKTKAKRKIVFYQNKIPINTKIISNKGVNTEEYVLDQSIKGKIKFDKDWIYKLLKLKDGLSLSGNKFALLSKILNGMKEKKISSYISFNLSAS